MATRDQLFRRLDAVIGTQVAAAGAEPPRLVRANSAFSKRKMAGRAVVEIDGRSHTVADSVPVLVES